MLAVEALAQLEAKPDIEEFLRVGGFFPPINAPWPADICASCPTALYLKAVTGEPYRVNFTEAHLGEALIQLPPKIQRFVRAFTMGLPFRVRSIPANTSEPWKG